MENAGFASFITCKTQIADMNECLKHWYTNKAFRDECREIYLEKRKKFRETGIIDKQQKKPYYSNTARIHSQIEKLEKTLKSMDTDNINNNKEKST